MPRKINKRKKIQAARRKAEQAAKPKARRVGMIAHHRPAGGGFAILLAAMLALKGGSDNG